MRKRLEQGGVLVLAAALLASGCAAKAADQAASKPALDPPQPVTVAAVVEQEVDRRVEVTGTLAAWEEATISLEADGPLAEVNADLGDRVAKGAQLARVSATEYEFRKTQAEADLAAAESDYKRNTDLATKNLITQAQLDVSRRTVEVARAATELARKKLSDTVLRAPFDGAVARRMINKGEYVRTGAPAFVVVRTTPLKFKGDVPERFAADVNRGDPINAVVDSMGGKALNGKIARIGASVAADSRSFLIEAEVENPGNLVKPGTFARVTITTKGNLKSLTVPETAIFEFAGTPRVYVVAGDKASERVIEIGGKAKDRVLVTKGLAVGDKVVTTGIDLLTDGHPILVRQ
jgi:membrane fusion protein, multidrug efflux system